MNIERGIYKHYKGTKYEVVDVAIHSETLERMVVYKALYAGDYPKGTIWVRPLKMFTEKVEVDGAITPRFEFVEYSLPY